MGLIKSWFWIVEDLLVIALLTGTGFGGRIGAKEQQIDVQPINQCEKFPAGRKAAPQLAADCVYYHLCHPDYSLDPLAGQYTLIRITPLISVIFT